MTTTTPITEAFEAKYQRSAEDPTSAEMLAIFSEGWNAATERAAKLCDAHAATLTSVGIRGRETAEECAAAIRASGGMGASDE